jgi:hypothetical protein
MNALLKHPYVSIAIAVIAIALTLTEAVNMTVARCLFVVAWGLLVFPLYEKFPPREFPQQFWPVAAFITVALFFFGLEARPPTIPENSGKLVPHRTYLLSPSMLDTANIIVIQFGLHASTISVTDQGARDMLFNMLFGPDMLKSTGLTVDLLDGKLVVSMRLLDETGQISADLVDNNWEVAQYPQTWDRNYDDNALEIIDNRLPHRVVLQVGLLGPRKLCLQGEWWDGKGHGIRVVNTLPVQLSLDNDPDEPRIYPWFKYPSKDHLGERELTAE